MFLLFSHNLSEKQKYDAKNSLKIEKFISLDENLQTIWSTVPSDLDNLDEYLKPIENFLLEHAKKDDVALIQGDFGASYKIINFSKNLGLKTVYATTNRIAEEYIKDNKLIKKSIFEHERFREYE